MNQSRYWREKNAELSAKNDALRQQLADVSNERDNFKAAYTEWSDKTDWVQRTVHWSELGKHRADVMKDRLRASEARNAELRSALEGMVEYFPEGHSDGECFSVEAANSALAQSAPATDELGARS